MLKRKLAAIAGATLTLAALLGTPSVAHAIDGGDPNPDPRLNHTSTGEEFRGVSFYLCKDLGIFCRK